KNGLRPDIQALDPALGTRAVISGQADGAILPNTYVLAAVAGGSEMRIVETVYFSAQVMTSTPEYTTLEQLKNKTIGVTNLASSNAASTVRMMRKHGMEPNTDYHLLQTGDAGGYPALAAALSTHQVDAATLDPDFARKLVAGGGFHNIVTFRDEGIMPAGLVLAFPPAYIAAHRDIVQKVTDTSIDVVRYAREHKKETEDAFRRIYNMTDDDEVESIYQAETNLWLNEPLPAPDQFADTIAAL